MASVLRRTAVASFVFLLAACSLPGSSSTPSPTPSRSLVVLAASSLKTPFDRLGTQFQSRSGITVTFSYAGTQTLVAQLKQGAAADVFASADQQHMADVKSAGLIHGSPQVFAHNRLEIAIARGNPKGIHTLADLARPGLVVVLADPSVPAGGYTQQMLNNAGVTVHPASLEQSVSGVLTKVALGEADAGIVYHSDVVSSGQVDGIAIPDSQNVIAAYPIAVLKAAANPIGAQEFIDFVSSSDGRAVLKADGFVAP